MNINEQKRYVFKKPYSVKTDMIIPVNSQLDIAHNTIYFNGGMCDTYSSGLFNHILNNETLKNEYLKEIKIINNKI